MYYILSSYDYTALINLSGIEQNKISQAVFNPDINNKSSLSLAKNELAKLGLVKKGAITLSGRLIAEAILSPESVISVVSCNAIDMATAHYCYANGFWVRILPNIDYTIITIETPIVNKDLGMKIKKDFLSDMDFEEGLGIDVSMTVGELIIFEVMQLALVDKVRKKGAPLNKDESAMSISEFINRKNILDASSAALILGDKDGYEISKNFWDTDNIISHIDGLVNKDIFNRVTEVKTGKKKYIMSEMSKRWLTLDSLVDKITIQKLPEGDIINLSITKAGIMTVRQNKQMLYFKTIAVEQLY